MSKDDAASIHQRLLNHAKKEGVRFNDVLQRYALERWLYRLSISAHGDQFVLKGALMLTAWGLPVTRPTRDIDMLARVNNDLDNIRKLIADVCRTECENDAIHFCADRVIVEHIAEDALYNGARAKFSGALGNAQIPMQVDLGFSDIMTPGPVDLTYPTILDLPAPHLKVYSRETAIAEKLEAMVKLGELNSRMKDFFDIWSLAKSQSFDGTVLSNAIARTFQCRMTSPDPKAICFSEGFGNSLEKQKQWHAFLKRSQLTGQAPDSFVDVWREVREFLLPMLQDS